MCIHVTSNPNNFYFYTFNYPNSIFHLVPNKILFNYKNNNLLKSVRQHIYLTDMSKYKLHYLFVLIGNFHQFCLNNFLININYPSICIQNFLNIVINFLMIHNHNFNIMNHSKSIYLKYNLFLLKYFCMEAFRYIFFRYN